MTDKHPKRPRDANQLAKSIVDLATGQTTDAKPTHQGEVGAAGGRKRAELLPKRRRVEIAKAAAKARWSSQIVTADDGDE